MLGRTGIEKVQQRPRREYLNAKKDWHRKGTADT
jgi:hypothetical protein